MPRVGDGGCDYAGGGCGPGNDAARDRHVLQGKILRLTPTGGIPADNPFRGADSRRCNIDGTHRPRLGLPGDLCDRPAQPVPDGLRPQRSRHSLLHQRRGTGELGGDRRGPGGSRLRLEHPRGPLRHGLEHQLRCATGRLDQPDPRLRTRRRLRLGHRRRLRAQRALALAVRGVLPVRRLRVRPDPHPQELRPGLGGRRLRHRTSAVWWT